MNLQIVKHDTDLVTLRILVVENLQKFDIVLAIVGFSNQWDSFASLKVNSCKQ